MSTEKHTEFLWPVRVYYEDTDAGGVVYYANYLKFMERARTECLRSLGFELDQLQQQYGIIFAVHNVSIQYKKPARFNDSLNVVTSIISLGKVSIVFCQKIFPEKGSVNTLPLCVAEVKIACLNAEQFSSQKIPAPVLQKISMNTVLSTAIKKNQDFPEVCSGS